eukprot:9475537-Pyramimonas_sp.AAC.1
MSEASVKSSRAEASLKDLNVIEDDAIEVDDAIESSSDVDSPAVESDPFADPRKLLRVGAGVAAGMVALKLILRVLGRGGRGKKSNLFVGTVTLEPPPLPPPPAAQPKLHGLTFAFDDVYVLTLRSPRNSPLSI